jgi:hypothetical protein
MSTITENVKRKKIKAWFWYYGVPKPLPIEMGCFGEILQFFELFSDADKSKDPSSLTYKVAQNRKEIETYNNNLKAWGLTEDELFEKNMPSLDEIWLWLMEDLDKTKKLALNKLGLDEETDLVQEPIIIYGPLFWTTPGINNHELVSVKDAEGKIYFSAYQLVIVCLSEERIATYSANFNFLRSAFFGEKTVEYLYQDIVSVSTEEKSTNYNLPGGKTLRRAQIFRLAVPSGDNVEVVTSSPEIIDLLGGEPRLTNHDQSVRAIREMLRSKK